MSTVEVEELKNKINEVQNQNKELSGKVDRVLSYLDNDNATGRLGIFQKVINAEKAIEEMAEDIADVVKKTEIAKAVKESKMATWGAIGAIIILIFKAFLTYFLSKVL